MDISIVVPCYNEEEVLKLFYKQISSVMEQMKDIKYELIFIDDGSSDGTLECLKKFHEEDKRYRYFSFSRNFGKESALYAGLKLAKGECIVVMDADLQDPPEYIPKMYEILTTTNCDCVATRRKDRKGEKRIRSFFSEMFYKLINKVSKVNIVDGARDFRMMNRKMVNAVLELSEYNRFSKGLFSWVGFKTTWIEYSNVERAAGDTKWSLMNLFKYSIDGIMDFSTLPLSLSSIGGILLCMISFLLIIVIIIKTLVWNDPVAGWPSMICAVCFIGGIQLLCIGILGQYLARAYIEVKHRPIYIIKETSDDHDSREE